MAALFFCGKPQKAFLFDGFQRKLTSQNERGHTMNHKRTYYNEPLENLLQDAMASVEIPEESREIINAYYETNVRRQSALTIRQMPKTTERFERLLAAMAGAEVERFILCHIPDEMLELDWLVQNYGYHVEGVVDADSPYRIQGEALLITRFG